jgi:eukaryotic-like serine/threonine-protein kinase
MKPGKPARQRFRQVEALFQAALGVPSDDLARWLDDACGEDGDLRREVAELLSAHEEATGFLEVPSSPGHPGEEADPTALRLGAYRLVHPLGEGGTSTVYLAVRADDAYQQRVAVKVLRTSFAGLEGMGGTSGTERFRRERQILAGLDHPYIARLLDGGTTPEGTPYLVMEYVEGVPIDQYCAEHNLTVDQRLELFLRVLTAVQFAHQSLVIHRDLKPGNILVRADGVPKLLDFGIAKLLNPELAGQVDPTRADLLLLTPNYASPEQIQGRPVTTASDVYSLGILLYRLLTGQLPQAVTGLGSVQEIVEAVCTTEPRLPSRAAAGLLEGTVARRLRGDLDHILLKALAKDPAQRYPTVAALADDLERHRVGKPVSVRCGSPAYRFGKFVLRHRWRVAAAVTLVALLLTLLGHALVQQRRTTKALARAEREHDRAEAINQFLVRTLVEANPYGSAGTGGEPTVAEAMVTAEKTLGETLADQPEVAVAIRNVLGNALDGLGKYEAAESTLRAALAQQVPGLAERGELPPVDQLPADFDLAETLNSLGMVAHHQGETAAAERWMRASLALMARDDLGVRYPRGRATFLQNLAMVLRSEGEFAEAEASFLEARATLRALPGREAARDAAFVLSNLATLHNAQGEYAEAADLLRQAVDEGRALYGDHHILVGDSLHNLGYTLFALGRYDEAQEILRQALEIRRAVLGEDHPQLADTYNVLGVTARGQGDYEAAAEATRAALELRRRTLGTDHPRLVSDLNLLASILCFGGRHEAAAPYLEEARRILAAIPQPRASLVATNRSLQARVHRARGELERAETLAREALDLRIELLGENHRAVALSRSQLGEIAIARRDPERALEHFQAALRVLTETVGERSEETLRAHLGEGRCLAALGRTAEAEERLGLVVRDPPPLLLTHRSLRRDYLSALVEFYETADRGAEADRVRAALRELEETAR